MRTAFRRRGQRHDDTVREEHDGTIREDLRGRSTRLEPAHLTLRTQPHPMG